MVVSVLQALSLSRSGSLSSCSSGVCPGGVLAPWTFSHFPDWPCPLSPVFPTSSLHTHSEAHPSESHPKGLVSAELCPQPRPHAPCLPLSPPEASALLATLLPQDAPVGHHRDSWCPSPESEAHVEGKDAERFKHLSPRWQGTQGGGRGVCGRRS